MQIPIWFQAVEDASAVRSGIMNLPMILGLIVMSVITGGAVSAIGYYTPLIHTSSILMSIGAGLLTTFRVNTQSPAWIGYQALYGIGAGLGMQLSADGAARTRYPRRHCHFDVLPDTWRQHIRTGRSERLYEPTQQRDSGCGC